MFFFPIFSVLGSHTHTHKHTPTQSQVKTNITYNEKLLIWTNIEYWACVLNIVLTTSKHRQSLFFHYSFVDKMMCPSVGRLNLLEFPIRAGSFTSMLLSQSYIWHLSPFYNFCLKFLLSRLRLIRWCTASRLPSPPSPAQTGSASRTPRQSGLLQNSINLVFHLILYR